MSRKVSANDIETIVGAARHESIHIGRAISVEQSVYILHSYDCLKAFDDLRECPFSIALDRGIHVDNWIEDTPVLIGIDHGRLVGRETA